MRIEVAAAQQRKSLQYDRVQLEGIKQDLMRLMKGDDGPGSVRGVGRPVGMYSAPPPPSIPSPGGYSARSHTPHTSSSSTDRPCPRTHDHPTKQMPEKNATMSDENKGAEVKYITSDGDGDGDGDGDARSRCCFIIPISRMQRVRLSLVLWCAACSCLN